MNINMYLRNSEKTQKELALSGEKDAPKFRNFNNTSPVRNKSVSHGIVIKFIGIAYSVRLIFNKLITLKRRISNKRSKLI